ncbi:hypothetical protein E2562_028309 [Oryza meyeriana var. granulata]|uniref:Uncharacterized protein n=1 Tax=Oryza meyeriana var. granulata TaxID=110450 RepID=A0A6G1FD41_9ORYZ|nr:hypothetical protein E2562_028309 [Oryza meyeriana var. granulata]
MPAPHGTAPSRVPCPDVRTATHKARAPVAIPSLPENRATRRTNHQVPGAPSILTASALAMRPGHR